MSGPRRSLLVDGILLALAAVIFVTLIGLGNWQMRRLDWKLELIETIDARAFGDPVAAPLGNTDLEYLRIELAGVYRHDLAQRIKAVTELGPGHWILTPLATPEQVVWINRGFVPTGLHDVDLTRHTGSQEVTGLVRMSQPGGTLLEDNDPAAGRWVSADLDLLSADAGLSAAGYFVDAAHTGDPNAWPRGGLTKLEFRNTHLSYALTWYAMAALFLGGMGYVIRDRWQASRRDDLRAVEQRS